MSMHKDSFAGNGGSEPASIFDLPGTAAAMARAGEAFGQRYGEWQREMLAFVSNRMKADMELPMALAGCRDAAEVAKVQQAWVEEATQAYLGESGRLAEIGASVVQGGMTSWFAALHEAADATKSVTEATVGDYVPTTPAPEASAPQA